MRPKPFSLQSLLNKFIHLLPWLFMVGLFYSMRPFSIKAVSWVILAPLLPLELLPMLV